MFPAARRVLLSCLLLVAGLAAVASTPAVAASHGALGAAAEASASAGPTESGASAGLAGSSVSAGPAGSTVSAGPTEPSASVGPVGASLAVSPTAARAAHGTSGTGVQSSMECAETPPPDHADPTGANGAGEANDTGDAIGWVEGYWYDEPLGFETADGLQAEERERFVARTAARVEALRCLDFERLPEVRVQTSEDYADQTARYYENESERVGRLMNAELAAMLLIGTDRDWADVMADIWTGGVAAYYQPAEDRITMFGGDGTDRPREWILGHELVHALQNQHFGSEPFQSGVRSTYDAERGVVEGDATLVQRAYAARCRNGAWSGSCVRPATPPGVAGSDDPGVFTLFQQPYLYGPSYVDAERQRGGWDDVDAIYDDVPQHSAFVVAPDRYGRTGDGNDSIDLPDVPDRSSDEWERVAADGRPDYDVVGQASLTTTFLAPALEGDPDADVVNRSDLRDPDTGRLSNFDQPETSGWRGDRLYAYSNGDRLASVWTLSWVDGSQASRFADAYRRLLDLRGAEAVDGREDAFRFPASARFDSAVELRTDGDRVTIVTAPTVQALDDVHGSADAAGAGPLPGFGVVAAIGALLVALTLAALGTAGRRSWR